MCTTLFHTGRVLGHHKITLGLRRRRSAGNVICFLDCLGRVQYTAQLLQASSAWSHNELFSEAQQTYASRDCCIGWTSSNKKFKIWFCSPLVCISSLLNANLLTLSTIDLIWYLYRVPHYLIYAAQSSSCSPLVSAAGWMVVNRLTLGWDFVALFVFASLAWGLVIRDCDCGRDETAKLASLLVSPSLRPFFLDFLL